jgi:Uma2 family endonuclease
MPSSTPAIADESRNQPGDFERPDPPDISHLITEDDTPVDNLLSEKQQRLLVTTLYSSWLPGVSFLAAANVGLFYGLNHPPLVPGVMLSLNVEVAADWERKENRSYFVWEFGKPPDVAIEIVSNKVGNELGSKLQDYARAAVAYYLVYDPLHQLGEIDLRAYELRGNQYIEMSECRLEQVRLEPVLWQGKFEEKDDRWLRWQDLDGNLLLTGDERAEQERQRAEQERQRADRLAELLRAQGIDPDAS